MVACLGGWLLNALPAAEVRLVLPLQPVVREGEGGLTLPAGGVLAEGDVGAIDLLEIQLSIGGVLQ
jgi:hypothetical protein